MTNEDLIVRRNEDADIFAAAVALLLERRDGEAAAKLATLSIPDPMPRFEAKGIERVSEPLPRIGLTKIVAARMYKRDGWRCRYCCRKLVFPYVLELLRTLSPGFKGLLPGHHMPCAETAPAVERLYPNIDHVEPRLNEPENLVTACTPCNSLKSDWRGWPAPRPPSPDEWDGLVSGCRLLIEQRRTELLVRRVLQQWLAALSQADAELLNPKDEI